jgi:hypothetical protein
MLSKSLPHDGAENRLIPWKGREGVGPVAKKLAWKKKCDKGGS